MSTSNTDNSGAQPSPTHVCDGCFAEFDWSPTEFEGQRSGCEMECDGGEKDVQPPARSLPVQQGAGSGQDEK